MTATYAAPGLILLVANLADMVTTGGILAAGGIEANPATAAIWAAHPGLLLGIKLAGPAGIAAAQGYLVDAWPAHPMRRALDVIVAGALAVYAAVLVNNVVVLVDLTS